MGTRMQGIYRWARQALPDCKTTFENRGIGYRISIRDPATGKCFEHKGEDENDAAEVKAVSDWIIFEVERRERVAKHHIPPGLDGDDKKPAPKTMSVTAAETALRRRVVERLMTERCMVDPDHIIDAVEDEMGRRFALVTVRADIRLIIGKWEKADVAARPGWIAMYLRKILALGETMEAEAHGEPKVYGPLVKLYDTIGKVVGATTTRKVEHEVKASKFAGWSKEEKEEFAKTGRVTAERAAQISGADGESDADEDVPVPTYH